MELAAWADTDRLIRWTQDATDVLLGHVSDFADDDPRWMGPYLPIVNPPIWELIHVGWFAEAFVLRRLHGRDSLLPDVDRRFDSSDVPHQTRWDLPYPDPQEAKNYVQAVADGLIDVLGNNRGLDSTNHFVAYTIAHHDAHHEALAYTRQTLEWGDLPHASTPEIPTGEPVSGDRSIDGARLLLGADRSQPFVMDNEKWAHVVHVDPYEMAATPVTIAQFAEFADDGGYERTELWGPEGWAWREESHADGPNYWRDVGNGWERRIGVAWQPIAETADHPMVHVNWFEAQAWCRWAGRRLPTEPEWEMAATTGSSSDRQPWYPWGNRDPKPTEAALDTQTGGTVPVSAFPEGDGPWGHRQLIGNVWEWTETDFEPYPLFEPDAYRQNSEPWFGTRKVLRGGSWATRNRYVRSTFRNYFTPDRRDIFAGFRTCKR